MSTLRFTGGRSRLCQRPYYVTQKVRSGRSCRPTLDTGVGPHHEVRSIRSSRPERYFHDLHTQDRCGSDGSVRTLLFRTVKEESGRPSGERPEWRTVRIYRRMWEVGGTCHSSPQRVPLPRVRPTARSQGSPGPNEKKGQDFGS